MHEFLKTPLSEFVAQLFCIVTGIRRAFQIIGTFFVFLFTTLVFFQSAEIDLHVLNIFFIRNGHVNNIPSSIAISALMDSLSISASSSSEYLISSCGSSFNMELRQMEIE